MIEDPSIEQILRWRLVQAENDAPAPPSASRLLERSRPWWQTWPDRFEALMAQLNTVRIAYGHAMVDNRPARSSHPVPTLLARQAGGVGTMADLLYFSVHADRLRLRFQLTTEIMADERRFEVTFVGETSGRPLLDGIAELTVDNEFRLDSPLPVELAELWAALRVTDRMPFRLIVRPVHADPQAGPDPA